MRLLLTDGGLYFFNVLWSGATTNSGSPDERIKNWAASVEKSKFAEDANSVLNKSSALPASASASGNSKTLGTSNAAAHPPLSGGISSTVTAVNHTLGKLNDPAPTSTYKYDCTGRVYDNQALNDDEVEETVALLNRHYLNSEIYSQSQLLAQADDYPLKRKRSEPDEGVDAPEAGDSNENGAIDVEMVVEGEPHGGQGARWSTTQNMAPTALKEPASKKVKSSHPVDMHLSGQPSNAPLGEYNTLEPNWFKKDPWRDGWKSRILPTLCLWAGAQSDVWNIPKDKIASVLMSVIPVVFPNINPFACELTSTHLCVGAAHQHLCNWRHDVGLAALALCADTFKFIKDSSQEVITTEATKLLKDNSYLYEDHDSSDPLKAFHSVFIIQLLATTYLSSISGYVHVDGIDTKGLVHSGIKGILGLCGAAIKRGLQLIAVFGSQAVMKGKMKPRTPATFKQIGKATTGDHSFSNRNWGYATRGLSRAAERRFKTQLAQIIEGARLVARKSQPDVVNETILEDDAEDEYARICK